MQSGWGCVGMPDSLKISFDVDAETATRFRSKIPYGLRAKVYVAVLRAILQSMDKEGPMILSAITGGDFEVRFKRRK
jgi:hypothetical protein